MCLKKRISLISAITVLLLGLAFCMSNTVFAEDVIDPEVFRGAFNRDDLGIIGAAEGLDGTLETSDAKGKNTKMDQRFQRKSIYTYTEISNDADQDQPDRIMLFGKVRKNE